MSLLTRLWRTDRDEVPATLDEAAPRTLGVLDQVGLWGNLGVSLLGFTGAMVVLQPFGDGTPRASLLAALLATVVGTVLGSLAMAITARIGAITGAPGMVLLRGLLGTRVSYVPTVLNTVQMLGWGTFELVTIATAVNQILPWMPTWPVVIISGLLATLLAIRPLGAIRILRRYVTIAVVIALVFLAIMLLRNPLPPVTQGTWAGFAPGVDTTLAVAVSWVPVMSDYSRNSRTPGAAFTGSFVGYSVTQVACYALGLIALVTVAADGNVFAAFIAVPLGGLAFAVLAIRELDQSFANVYSTTVSVQNLRPRWDRRILTVIIGVVIIALALLVDIEGYSSFLSLIGSVFVPLFAVLLADYYLLGGRRRWQTGGSVPARWIMLVPWIIGFVVYQLIYPGAVGWWATAWSAVSAAIGFTPRPWMSASLFSFAAALIITVILFPITRRLDRTVAAPDSDSDSDSASEPRVTV